MAGQSLTSLRPVRAEYNSVICVSIVMRCLLLLASVLGVVSPQFLFEGSDCRLKDGSVGECKPIHSCPEAFKQLQGRFGSYSRHVRCSFDKYTEIICCPIPDSATSSSGIDASDGIFFRPDDPETNNPWDVRPTSTSTSPTGTDTAVRLEARKATDACDRFVNMLPPSISLHVLGGENAGPGEFPHMVALGYEKEDGLDFDCGGTLISERYILTAAHCVENLSRLPPTIARMGTVTLSAKGINPETDYRIIKNIVHPQYRRSLQYNDIALLELEKDADFSAILYPACLNTDPRDPQDVMVVTGWGSTDLKKRSKSTILQKANLTAVDVLVCNQTYTRRRDRRLPSGLSEDQMCAVGTANDIDSCDGDSGGPLQVLYDSSKYDTFYKLVGITSFGRACGGGIPAVYTRISNYLDWIESEVWP